MITQTVPNIVIRVEGLSDDEIRLIEIATEHLQGGISRGGVPVAEKSQILIIGHTAENLTELIQSSRELSVPVIVMAEYYSVADLMKLNRIGVTAFVTRDEGPSQIGDLIDKILTRAGVLRPSFSAFMSATATAIHNKRRERGWTLAVLAGKTGLSLGYLSQIELGKNSPSVESLHSIATAFGGRLAVFLDGR